MECDDHNIRYVKKLNAAGNYYIKKQCLTCGQYQSGGAKIKDIGGKEKLMLLPDWDQEAYDFWLSIYFEELDEKRDEKYAEQQKVFQEQQKEKKQEWYKEANEYYNSERWKLKREFVLKRDNYLCQACLCNKANQVHHLTYKHWKCEPLFELTSVCKQCHDKITRLDNVQVN